MKCIFICFKKSIFSVLSKLKRFILSKITDKNGGLSKMRIIWIYLEYIDIFMPKNSVRFSMARLSLVTTLSKKIVFMKLLYKIENYSNIKITKENWNSYIELIDKITIFKLNSKRKERFITQSIEILIYDAFYGRGEDAKDLAFEDIKKVCKLLELESSQETQKYILDCAKYIFNISNEIPSLEIVDNRLNTFQLMALERVSLMLGFISSSYLFKEKAREKYIQNFYLANDKKSLATIKNAFFSALEIGDYETMKNTVEIAKKELKNQKIVDALDYLYKLFTKQNFKGAFAKLLNDDEVEFSKFIKNKSVAIVAPLPVETLSGSLIDAHDFVLRMGTINHPDYLEPKIYGSRTDISSTNFSDITGSKFIKDGKINIDKNLKYLIFKKLESTILKNYNFLIPTVRNRTLYGRYYTLSSTLNHVPELVLFLLGCGASKISLFSMNFFMDSSAYDKNYRNSSMAYGLCIAGDNLISSHIYLKKLHMLGLVECDKNALKVIELSTKEYSYNMENIYINMIRKK